MGVTSPVLSVIVPFYNEENNLEAVIERLRNVLTTLSIGWEIILVDNCSTDSSFEIVSTEAKKDVRIKLIRFSRNFGPSVEASIAAGFKACTGDAAIVVYSDLQDPPELIPDFVREWQAGADVVYGVQTARPGDPKWRNSLVQLFYGLLSKLSDTPVHPNSGDFKLISRRVIDQLNLMPERARFSRGLISWIGFKETPILYSRAPRTQGKSKSNFWAISYTALTGITSFSLKPLRLLTWLGLFTILASAAGGIVVISEWLFGGSVPGLSSILVLMFLTLGLNMGALGLLGEYLGRIQLEVKSRPQYVIDETINLTKSIQDL